MTALAADRKDNRNYAPMLKILHDVGVEAGEVLYVGALVALDSDGYGVPASTATGLVALGICRGDREGGSVKVDNSGGADGDVFASVESGVFAFKNSASSDEITIANIGDDCYIVDDQTVAKTSGSSTRSVAGKVVGLDDSLVQVLVGPLAWDFPLTGELTEPGVADRTALKAIAAGSRYNGKRELVRSDGSHWVFSESSTASDSTENLVCTPAAGSGRWLREDRCFALSLPITFATADGATVFTCPAGFVLKLAAHPYYDVSADFTGGSSSSIGLSCSRTGYTDEDALIAATVAAALTAGVRPGTIGTKLDALSEFNDFFLEATQTLRHERIASAFTAGTANVRVPVAVCTAPSIA